MPLPFNASSLINLTNITLPLPPSTPNISFAVILLPPGAFTKTIPFLPRVPPLGNNCAEIPTGNGGSTTPGDSGTLYQKLFINYDQQLLGDIGALTNGELIKFIRSDMTSSAEAKPTFIYSQFKYPVTSSVDNKPKVTIYNNLSYTQPTNLIPWYDSYEDYFKNIKHLSQNASVIPEFIVSNFDNIANDNLAAKTGCEPDYYGNSAYETLYGRDYFLQTTPQGQDLEDFDKLPINKFIDKKSNRFKMVLTGVKKLLPYNGFYPSEYSKNIVGAFSDAFFYNITSLEKQTLLQPLFGPGVFFNTIKAGVVCAYPFVQTGSTSGITSPDDLYVSGTLKLLKRKATFDMLLDPTSLMNNSGSIVYLDPARYMPYFGNSFIIPSASTSVEPNKDSLKKYKKILNNFLSETTSLFLQDSKLTSFVSSPQSKFGVTQAGRRYGMEIKISTGDYFSTLTRTENFPPGETIASVYGPKLAFGDYLSHAPPYLQGTDSETRRYSTGDTMVVYVPIGSTVRPTAQQIVNSLYIATGSYGGVIGDGVPIKDFIASSSYHNSLFDALDIFKLIDLGTSSDYSLEIRTKFEVPLLNYIDKSIQVPQSSSYKVQTSSSSGLGTGSVEIVDYSIDGVWNRYGSLPKSGQSIQLEISDDLFKESSLLELLGFTRESKSLGVIANYKTVSEAVLVIPYQLIGSRVNTTTQPIEKSKNFINIDRDKVSKALGVDDYAKMKICDIKKKLDTYTGPLTTLINTLKTLINYNVPPHLNWLYDTSIKPFAIYSAIFEHKLDRQELANIWQGMMPSIAEVPQIQEITIEHEFGADEMLGKTIFTDGQPTYFKVLKVKQRGHYEYKNIQGNTTEQLDNKQWYSYNWPYDYFSLVELLNIKAGEVYDTEPMPVPEYADPGLNLQSQLLKSQIDLVKQSR